MDQPLSVYLPADRREVLARGTTLPDRSEGAALFADLSGFTPLAEALTQLLGVRRGAEELTRQLNLIYDALIAEVDRYGGSVVAFAGDAITCWFDGAAGGWAVPCALAMQEAIRPFATLTLPGGARIDLGMKAGIASGSVRRFVVGNPNIQLMDVLAGETVNRMAAAALLARRGEVVADILSLAALEELPPSLEERHAPMSGERFVLVPPLPLPLPTPSLPPSGLPSLPDSDLRPWLLPAVYERLRAGQGEFLTELRPAVALFLRFGGIDYENDPEAGQKLDGYLRWVQSILAHYEGVLLDVGIGDKGDCLYGAFGAPIAHEDDATRAVATALALRASPSGFDFIPSVQIGLSQGVMRVGAYGGSTRRTYGVLGDEVNLAARLMERAAPGQILASGRIRNTVGDSFAWQPLPEIQIRGKSEIVPVWTLGESRQQRLSYPQELAFSLPMVGREAELAQIQERMTLALAGRGQIVGITAEAGMGKSRLAAEAVGLWSHLGGGHRASFYRGECESYGMSTPYMLWQGIWQNFFALDPTQPMEAQAQTLGRALEQINPILLPRLPLLGSVLNLPLPESQLTASLDPSLRKASREALLIECLRARLGAPGAAPLLLLLEDVHWIDPLSEELLAAIARAMGSLPLMILLTYRPLAATESQLHGLTALPHFTELPLDSLVPTEAEQLIQAKLTQIARSEAETTQEPLPPEVVEQLIQRAQGNPFYIEELLNYLHDRGLDPHSREVWKQIELPASLHSLILSRIDQLSEHQKSTLKVASIIGRLFRVAWLCGYYPALGEPAQVRADLDVMGRLDITLLETPEPMSTYLFKHIVTQEVAYESLAYATRAALHEQFARYLEGDAGDRLLDLLAFHYERSENRAKKRDYLWRAGEAAQASYANQAAIDYYERLLPLLESDEAQVDILLKRGNVLELLGRWEEAERHYCEVLTLTERQEAGELWAAPARARCQRMIGGLLNSRSVFEDSLAWLEQARAGWHALLPDPDARAELSRTLAEIGFVLWQQGNYVPARARLEESLALARALGDHRGMSFALNQLGHISLLEGDHDGARSLYGQALQLRRELGDKEAIVNSLYNLGLVVEKGQSIATRRALYEESLALAREIGYQHGIAHSLGNLGLVAHEQGEYDAARALYEESLELMEALGDRQGMAYSLSSVGWVAAAQGDLPAAERWLAESLAHFQGIGNRRGIAVARHNLGWLRLEQGDSEAARREYQESLTLFHELGDKRGIALTLVGLAALVGEPLTAEHAGEVVALLAMSDALLSEIGAERDALVERLYEQTRARARQGLDAQPDAFATAWAEGQRQSMEEAIARAMTIRQ